MVPCTVPSRIDCFPRSDRTISRLTCKSSLVYEMEDLSSISCFMFFFTNRARSPVECHVQVSYGSHRCISPVQCHESGGASLHQLEHRSSSTRNIYGLAVVSVVRTIFHVLICLAWTGCNADGTTYVYHMYHRRSKLFYLTIPLRRCSNKSRQGRNRRTTGQQRVIEHGVIMMNMMMKMMRRLSQGDPRKLLPI